VQFKESPQIFLGHLVALEFVDFGVAEVDYVHVQGVDQHFEVAVDWVLRDREERVLTNVVLQPEVAKVVDCRVFKRVSVGEQIAGQGLVPELRRLVHSCHHMRLFSLMAENSPCCLVPVHECQL
jgi:hypothetical protein